MAISLDRMTLSGFRSRVQQGAKKKNLFCSPGGYFAAKQFLAPASQKYDYEWQRPKNGILK